MKRRINLTIEEEVLAQAEQVARARKRSLSNLVEGSLRREVHEATFLPTAPGIHWLDRFHATYLPEGFSPPTDAKVQEIRKGMLRKHSPEKGRGAMKRACITELKARLSAYLKKVQAGESVLITEGERPVAILAPVTPADEEAWMDLLVRSDLVRAPTAPLTDDFFRWPPQVKDPKARVRKALFRERHADDYEAERKEW